jgi:hypothetical protein
VNGDGGVRSHRALWIAVSVVVVLAIGAVVVLVTRDDGDGTHNAVTTTTRPLPATTIPGAATTAVWPPASSTVVYHDPVSAAKGFAVDYVGFTDPVVGEFRAGDSRSGEVPVRPSATGPETIVLVRQLGADGTWSVMGSQTANLQPSAPTALAAISSPVTLRGTSTAFEATVNVEIREDGNRQPLAKTTFMGGSNGQMGPYEATVTFAQPHAASGAVVLFTISPKDGHIAEATVARVRFAAP